MDEERRGGFGDSGSVSAQTPPAIAGGAGATAELQAAICEVLSRIDAGDSVSTEWLRSRYPDQWTELRDALALHVQLSGSPEPRDRAGPYRLEEWLGRGGMGTVYRARRGDEGGAAQAPVAVKLLHSHLLRSPGASARFRREAAIGGLIRHPNVVATYDVGCLSEGGERADFLVMEYVEGQTLRGLIDEIGCVPEELCRHIAREVAKGLAAIHAAGVVHRDLKPENVLITRDHVVKVMDLGVARIDDENLRLSRTGTFLGSVLYAAPEQFAGRADVDGRTDLHAVGLVLYELATGVRPYAAENFRAVVKNLLEATPRRCSELNPQVSPFFDEVVHTLLAKDRSGRFASAEELVRVLEAGEDSEWWRARRRAIRTQTRQPLRRMRIPRETKLHGRDAELGDLRALYEKAKAGDGAAALIEGEAGIGKSRLVDEFVHRLRDRGEDVNWLHGSYPPGGAATAAGAFAAAYGDHFCGDDAAVREALPDTPFLVPAFAALLRGDAPPPDEQPLTKDSLQSCFAHATRHLASERTTIVVIEDLHFAPEEGRALFASLALAAPGHRVLLVGTMRPGVEERWLADVHGGGVGMLRLDRLGRDSLVSLLSDAFRSDVLAQEIVGKVAERSDGNALFVLEILRALREDLPGAQRGAAGPAAVRRIEDVEIPASIERMIRARVEGMDAADMDLLGIAACCGFEFDPLLAAAAAGADVTDTLKRFAKIERTQRLVRSAGRRFVFDHHLVQEVVSGELPVALRELHHASIAAALERISGAAGNDPAAIDGALCAELAGHWLAGAQGGRALPYLEGALTWLARRHHNDAAIRLADDALSIPGLLGGDRRCRVLLAKIDRLDLLGRRRDERPAIDEAIALADASGDAGLRITARARLCVLFRETGRFGEAERAAAEVIRLARGTGDLRQEMVGSAHMATVLWAGGRPAEARPFGDRHLALARELGDRKAETNALVNLGHAEFIIGNHGAARAVLEEGIALARSIGSAGREAEALTTLGSIALAHGRLDEASRAWARSLELARAVGDRRRERVNVSNLGIVLTDLGHFAEGRALHERGLALSRATDAPRGESVALTNLADDALFLGSPAESETLSRQALAIAQGLGLRFLQGIAHAGIGLALAERDAHAEAETELRAGREMLRAVGRPEKVLVHLDLAALLARTGRRAEAVAALEEALAESEAEDQPHYRVRALAELAVLGARDAAVAERALAEVEARTGILVRMHTRQLLWKATRDAGHLAEARRLLDYVVEHAPPDCRGTMIANVRLHREIAEAAAAAGI